MYESLDHQFVVVEEPQPEQQITFPNGFESWHETHFEVVKEITYIERSGLYPGGIIEHINSTEGQGGLYDLAERLTNEFEKMTLNKNLEGSYFDTLEAYLKLNLIQPSGERRVSISTYNDYVSVDIVNEFSEIVKKLFYITKGETRSAFTFDEEDLKYHHCDITYIGEGKIHVVCDDGIDFEEDANELGNLKAFVFLADSFDKFWTL